MGGLPLEALEPTLDVDGGLSAFWAPQKAHLFRLRRGPISGILQLSRSQSLEVPVVELLPEVKFQGKLASALRGGSPSEVALLKGGGTGLGSGSASTSQIG
jgi:hypothetical protein